MEFKDVIFHVLGANPLNLLKQTKVDTITELLNTCKINGLSKEECRVDKFIQFTMGNLKKSQVVDAWKEQVKVCFEQALSTTYVSSSIKKYIKPLTHEEQYEVFSKDSSKRLKRQQDMDRLCSLSLGTLSVGDLMDTAANCNDDISFNKYCQLAGL